MGAYINYLFRTPKASGCSEHAYRCIQPVPGCWKDHISDFNISVHFDDGSQRYFSELRIVLTVVDRDNNAALPDGQNSPPLEDVSNTTTHSYLLPENSARSPYAVVYEIIKERDNLPMLLGIYLRSAQLLDNNAYRIVYEHTQLCTSARLSVSVMLSLKTNRSLWTLERANAFPNPEMGIITYGIRIVPPTSSRQLFKQPPPEILRLIFTSSLYSMGKKDDRWQESLLSFGLVCRAWVHALDLLYRDVFRGGWPSPNINRFAAALRHNPARAGAIRCFSTHYFIAMLRSDETDKQVSRSLIDILSKATLVQELDVDGVVFDHKDMYMQALCGCTEVRNFGIAQTNGYPDRGSPAYVPAVSDVIQCMTHWPHLRVLSMLEFVAGHLDSGYSVSDKLNSVLWPRLEQLILLRGEISGHHLLRVTPPSLSSLKEAHLGGLTGLNNASLKEWLLAVAPTLEELTIGRCIIQRENDHEGFAIDEVIDKMDKLHILTLDADSCSQLVFTRKAKRSTSGITHKFTLLRLLPESFTEDFLAVLRCTGWEDINLWIVSTEELELIERAKKVAEEQGIHLRPRYVRYIESVVKYGNVAPRDLVFCDFFIAIPAISSTGKRTGACGDPQNFGCSVHAYRSIESIPADQRRYSDFNISAHFDGGSERYFSGFRIVLVYKKSDEGLVDLTVVDRDDGAASSNGRISLEDVSSTGSKSHSYLENSDRSPYVVVYEVMNTFGNSYMVLDIHLRSAQLLDDNAYHIAYERNHLHMSACPSTSVILSLKTNRSL
ncbi:hypothetical protein EVG20_g2665 [Dentipellis fragilis]|uniref:Uncharacterized protein n=1 Tax=Dentipellis fragilis TaxID=205917 RepID=A0A4Y9Z941_9AGAM|nr:hypothetical protein EVG20_g2665 [Dentipellis fragilis]